MDKLRTRGEKNVSKHRGARPRVGGERYWTLRDAWCGGVCEKPGETNRVCDLVRRISRAVTERRQRQVWEGARYRKDGERSR